jgi:hypothetical protein
LARVPSPVCAEVPQPVERDTLLARCEIAEGYYRGGDRLALELLASSSLRLYGYVVEGELSAADLFDSLQECAENLGIAARAQDDVQAALAYGPAMGSAKLWKVPALRLRSNTKRRG